MLYCPLVVSNQVDPKVYLSGGRGLPSGPGGRLEGTSKKSEAEVLLPKTVELWNKNILIAGFGRIGQALIKRCHGFEMKVFVYDPFVSKEIIDWFLY